MNRNRWFRLGVRRVFLKRILTFLCWSCFVFVFSVFRRQLMQRSCNPFPDVIAIYYLLDLSQHKSSSKYKKGGLGFAQIWRTQTL